MSFSVLPLSYCANVHPGLTVAEVQSGLELHTLAIGEHTNLPHAVGLWLAASVIEELKQDSKLNASFRDWISEHEITCYTMNTFPYGNFHSERVKEQVYLPDWTTPQRLDYTLASASLLSLMLPAGTEGSLSSVPLGFKRLSQAASFQTQCIDQLLQLAIHLDDLHDESGKVLRLAIEPEPLCVLETTPETLAFFKRLYQTAEDRNLLDIAQRHLGVCYDVCHQSVEFEDVAESIRQLEQAEIRINKVHITCAIDVDFSQNASAKRDALKSFVEPRYLHQTFAHQTDGTTVSLEDLTADAVDHPAEKFRNSDHWRVHFHVPVNSTSVGPLGTTHGDLIAALKAIDALDYAPHLEVETYTWSVLPGEQKPLLAKGIADELNATQRLLQQIRAESAV